jgi:phosphonate transport system substrate-binding protein
VDAAFGPGFKERLRAALLAVSDPSILTSFARSRFIPAANSDYAPVEEVAKATGLFN